MDSLSYNQPSFVTTGLSHGWSVKQQQSNPKNIMFVKKHNNTNHTNIFIKYDYLQYDWSKRRWKVTLVKIIKLSFLNLHVKLSKNIVKLWENALYLWWNLLKILSFQSQILKLWHPFVFHDMNKLLHWLHFFRALSYFFWNFSSTFKKFIFVCVDGISERFIRRLTQPFTVKMRDFFSVKNISVGQIWIAASGKMKLETFTKVHSIICSTICIYTDDTNLGKCMVWRRVQTT